MQNNEKTLIDKNQELNVDNHEKEKNWFLVIISLLCLFLLLAIYVGGASIAIESLGFFPGVFVQLVMDLIPGFVGALFAYVLFYFVFTSKGINIGQSSSESVVDPNRNLDNYVDIRKLYTLYGLRKTRLGEIYQNFDIQRTNRNVVQFLWSDIVHQNRIEAKIVSNQDAQPWLRVHFHIQNNLPNQQNWGCNLAIKPQNDLALDNKSPKRRYLIFDARVPRDIFDDLQTQGHTPLETVGFAIRLVNGYMQHWEYGSNKAREPVHIEASVNTDGWKPYYFDLDDKEQWGPFDSDGLLAIRKGPRLATFDEIASLVIKFGRPKGFGEFGPGEGVIDIRNIRLSESTPQHM